MMRILFILQISHCYLQVMSQYVHQEYEENLDVGLGILIKQQKILICYM